MAYCIYASPIRHLLCLTTCEITIKRSQGAVVQSQLHRSALRYVKNSSCSANVKVRSVPAGARTTTTQQNYHKKWIIRTPPCPATPAGRTGFPATMLGCSVLDGPNVDSAIVQGFQHLSLNRWSRSRVCQTDKRRE